MSRRTRRLLLPTAVLALVGGLAACGDDTDGPQTVSADSSPSPSGSTSSSPASSADDAKALDTLTVTGEFGKEPKVTFKDPVAIGDVVSKVVTEGKGATLAEGDGVFAQIWLGNGTSKQVAYSSYSGKPALLTLDSQVLPALAEGLVGQKIGSRVLIGSGPQKAFGDTGNSQLGIGNADTIVFVVDLLRTMPDGPSGADRTPAKWAPTIEETGGMPSGLDFTGAPDPTGKLLRTTLIEGTGPVTKKGDHLYVDYLGQVFGAEEPFDQSYARGTPFDFDLGAGAVVKGWDQGLAGVKVGSRVLLQIPPDFGYGDAGKPEVGIEGTDTMYFVVDVLAAS